MRPPGALAGRLQSCELAAQRTEPLEHIRRPFAGLGGHSEHVSDIRNRFSPGALDLGPDLHFDAAILVLAHEVDGSVPGRVRVVDRRYPDEGSAARIDTTDTDHHLEEIDTTRTADLPATQADQHR